MVKRINEHYSETEIATLLHSVLCQVDANAMAALLTQYPFITLKELPRILTTISKGKK